MTYAVPASFRPIFLALETPPFFQKQQPDIIFRHTRYYFSRIIRRTIIHNDNLIRKQSLLKNRVQAFPQISAFIIIRYDNRKWYLFLSHFSLYCIRLSAVKPLPDSSSFIFGMMQPYFPVLTGWLNTRQHKLSIRIHSFPQVYPVYMIFRLFSEYSGYSIIWISLQGRPPKLKLLFALIACLQFVIKTYPNRILHHRGR